MANEHWYLLKVRSGFEGIAAQRLRKLNLEVFVPERETMDSRESHHGEYPLASHICCRLALDNRHSVIRIPGVLDIMGTPDPTPFDGDFSVLQSATGSRLYILRDSLRESHTRS